MSHTPCRTPWTCRVCSAKLATERKFEQIISRNFPKDDRK